MQRFVPIQTEEHHGGQSFALSLTHLIPIKGIQVLFLFFFRLVKFFHNRLNKPILYGPSFVHIVILFMLEQNGPFRSTQFSRMSLYAIALIFVFTGIKTPSQTHYSEVGVHIHIIGLYGKNVVTKVAK